MSFAIGKSIPRKEAWKKVTGEAKYTDDFPAQDTLFARLVTSSHAHAKIVDIDISDAISRDGVKAVLVGKDFPEQFGALILDRPALARDVVRYFGEPVALVVATDEAKAEAAARLIKVKYQLLPVVLTPSEAVAEGAPIIHNPPQPYKTAAEDVFPEAGTNIAASFRIRKGDAKAALSSCKKIVERKYYLPPSDHVAMEVRSARAEISADGTVTITTSSQAPYAVRKQLADAFSIPSGMINIKVPFVGGAFGGKVTQLLEPLAYIASKSVGGKAVRVILTREQDVAAAPCRMGLEATVKIGADESGIIRAMEVTYLVDCGAYSDISPYMAKAAAVDCTGPYSIENVHCDALCVYTNHTFATSYRGFSHDSTAFCIERTMDILAKECGIDPLEFRLKNAIRPGSLSPTRVLCTESIVGNLPECINKVKEISEWGGKNELKKGVVNAKGIACFWKSENPPTDAISGAMITFNPDGSVNLNTGVVEIGCGAQTNLTQMLAERLKLDISKVHAVMPVDTFTAPDHWKTVASLTEYMTGQAVMRAADDIVEQLKSIGSQAFGCLASDIEVSEGKVFPANEPNRYIAFTDIVQGFKSQEGESIGEPVLGRGGYMLKGLSALDPVTGEGKTGPAWTLGAQVVEVEVDIKTFTYRIVNASTVMDVGKIINPALMHAVVSGGMAMGISMASREAFSYDEKGILKTPNFRTYKVLHIGQEPDYKVGFAETAEEDSPYGIRAYSEHGIIGIPAALANALSIAFDTELNTLPLKPENIYKACSGRDDDSV